jgi:hypothetical protein
VPTSRKMGEEMGHAATASFDSIGREH